MGMCSYKSLLTQPYSRYSQMVSRTRQECATTSPYCLSPAVITQRQGEELDMNVQIQILIASVLQLVLADTEKNQIGMCSYKSLLPQSYSRYSQTESRTKQECAATSPYCLSPAVITQRQGEELDMNVQIQILIASVLHSVIKNRENNSIAMCSYKSLLPQSCSHYSETERRTRQESADTSPYCLNPAVSTQRQGEELDKNVQVQVLIASALQSVLTDREKNQIGMCRYKSLLPQSYSQYSETGSRTRQECAATSPYCLSPAVITQRQGEELDMNVQIQILIASVLHSVIKNREKNSIAMCSYKSLLPQSCSHYSETERRTRQESVDTSPYCLNPAVSTQIQGEELDKNVQVQVLIASALQSVLTDTEKNQIGMCRYKSLLPQSCSQYSETGSRTRQECAATSPYCLSNAVSTHRQREELDRNVQLQVLIASALQSVFHRQREELDRNVQLQVLIDSALQSVLRDREKNQIGMCRYKSLLIQSYSQFSQTERRTRQECAATSLYCLSSVVSTKRQREELDRNVQLQVLIVSVLQLGLTDTEKNQIGMCSYKFLLTQPYSRYSQTERRTRQECADTSPYCLSLAVGTRRHREELDKNVQLQVLIASVLQSVLRDGEQNQIEMCSYKSLLTQPCSRYSQMERRTRQECATTSLYCLSTAVDTKKQREELDMNVQLQVLIASAMQSVLRDWEQNQIGMCCYKSLLKQSCSQYSKRKQNQIGMCSYKSLLPQPYSQYSETERMPKQESAATSPYCFSPAVGSHRQREELDRNVQIQVLIASALQLVLKDRDKN